MSAGRVCDNCNAVLKLDARGEDEHGEIATWLKVQGGGYSWDACTRSCAHELLDSEIAPVLDEVAQSIAEVVRAIRDDGEAARD